MVDERDSYRAQHPEEDVCDLAIFGGDKLFPGGGLGRLFTAFEDCALHN
jgi:hypothetical protein